MQCDEGTMPRQDLLLLTNRKLYVDHICWDKTDNRYRYRLWCKKLLVFWFNVCVCYILFFCSLMLLSNGTEVAFDMPIVQIYR